jgi:hypothetical protein
MACFPRLVLAGFAFAFVGAVLQLLTAVLIPFTVPAISPAPERAAIEKLDW